MEQIKTELKAYVDSQAWETLTLEGRNSLYYYHATKIFNGLKDSGMTPDEISYIAELTRYITKGLDLD